MDIYETAILNYVRERDGQTVLMKDLCKDLKISDKTAAKKIKSLTENGQIKREGKKFYYLGGVE